MYGSYSSPLGIGTFASWSAVARTTSLVTVYVSPARGVFVSRQDSPREGSPSSLSTAVMRPGAAISRFSSPTMRTLVVTGTAAGCGSSSRSRAKLQPLPSKSSSACIRHSAGSDEVISSIVAPVRRLVSGP